MTPSRPLPEIWYPLAQFLLALRALIRAASPDGFAAIAARVRRELRLTSALVRRYLFAVAYGITLPPPRATRPPADPHTVNSGPGLRRREPAFDPGERPGACRAAHPAGPSAPEPGFQWAVALNSAEAPLAVLRNPLPAARRLAFRFARDKAPPLHELPVPSHVLRAVPPALDALLMRLDALARPDAWAGMHPDTG
ncbi:hypothetical protein [Hyphomonas sp.]|uniref:hypothetical protein n=1 Tax=Hyphomonas sp. TaxID=87 RepID=UPI0025BC4E96|nr:hypothetical protein [Hyphomonas sp.]